MEGLGSWLARTGVGVRYRVRRRCLVHHFTAIRCPISAALAQFCFVGCASHVALYSANPTYTHTRITNLHIETGMSHHPSRDHAGMDECRSILIPL